MPRRIAGPMTERPRVECGDWSPLWRSAYWHDQAARCLEFHEPSSSRTPKRLENKGRQADDRKRRPVAALQDGATASRVLLTTIDSRIRSRSCRRLYGQCAAHQPARHPDYHNPPASCILHIRHPSRQKHQTIAPLMGNAFLLSPFHLLTTVTVTCDGYCCE